MNKRIKKKKAKQAELKRQQELEQLLQNPEQVFQALQSLCVALSNVFKNASVAFANAADCDSTYITIISQKARMR